MCEPLECYVRNHRRGFFAAHPIDQPPRRAAGLDARLTAVADLHACNRCSALLSPEQPPAVRNCMHALPGTSTVELWSCGRAMSWITTPVPHPETCAEMTPLLNRRVQEMVVPQLVFYLRRKFQNRRRLLLTSMLSRQGRAWPATVTPVRPRPTTCTSNT